MADTFTISLDLRFPQKVGAYGKVGMITGSVNISSYSQTKAAITAITGLFRTTFRCVADGVSSGGYAMRWDTSANAFRAYATGAASTDALSEAANATNIGSFNFVAIGQIATGS